MMPADLRSIAALASTICLLVPGLLIPLLEINATHLFHPEWPPHARMHEAWQLITNAAFAWGALGIALKSPESRIPHGVGLTISAAFIFAWLLRDHYGGSMGDAGTANLTIAGVDVAVLVMGVASLLHIIGFLTRDPRSDQGSSKKDA